MKPNNNETVAPAFYFTCEKLHMTLLNTSCADSRQISAKSSCGFARSDSCRKCTEHETQQKNERMNPDEYHRKIAQELAAAPSKKPRADAPFRPFYGKHR